VFDCNAYGAFVCTKLLHTIVYEHQLINWHGIFNDPSPGYLYMCLCLFYMPILCSPIFEGHFSNAKFMNDFIVFSFINNISRFTKRNSKANWNIFLNKTNFPNVAVHGGCVLLPVYIYRGAAGIGRLF